MDISFGVGKPQYATATAQEYRRPEIVGRDDIVAILEEEAQIVAHKAVCQCRIAPAAECGHISLQLDIMAVEPHSESQADCINPGIIAVPYYKLAYISDSEIGLPVGFKSWERYAIVGRDTGQRSFGIQFPLVFPGFGFILAAPVDAASEGVLAGSTDSQAVPEFEGVFLIDIEDTLVQAQLCGIPKSFPDIGKVGIEAGVDIGELISHPGIFQARLFSRHTIWLWDCPSSLSLAGRNSLQERGPELQGLSNAFCAGIVNGRNARSKTKIDFFIGSI